MYFRLTSVGEGPADGAFSTYVSPIHKQWAGHIEIAQYIAAASLFNSIYIAKTVLLYHEIFTSDFGTPPLQLVQM